MSETAPAVPPGSPPPTSQPPTDVATLDDLFAPPAYAWKRLSPKYLQLRRVMTLVGWPLLFTVPAVIFLLIGVWQVSIALWALAAIIVGLRWIFLERVCNAWGYVEREDDLYITHGIWFRSLTAVPYGRMQLVEVESGPVERRFGLASVTLKTASPGTDASIPGLEPDEAARLRDQLTALGEARQSGL